MTISAPATNTATSNAPDDVVVVNGRKDIQSFDDPDGPSFSDVLDVINPLQHIPIINTIYQHLTGDKEGAVADLAGGMLWGGPIGLGAAMANLVVESITGKSISDNALALVDGDEDGTATADAGQAGQQVATQSDGKAPDATPVQVMALTPAEDAAAPETQASTTTAAVSQNGPISAGEFLVFGGSADTGATATGTLAQATRQAETQKAATQAVQAMAALDQSAAGQPVSLTPKDSPLAQAAAARTTGQTATGTPRGLNSPAAAATTAPGAAPMSAAAAVLAAQAQPAQATAGRANDGITRAGDFLIFGAGEPAGSSLPPVSAAPGPQRGSQAATASQGNSSQAAGNQTANGGMGGTQVADASGAPVQLTPNNQNAMAQQVAANQMAAKAASRAYAAPQRRNIEAPQALPMPTTGPAAVPGSQAQSQARTDGGNAWFASAFNQAMDKYDRSRTLLDGDQTAPSSTVH